MILRFIFIEVGGATEEDNTGKTSIVTSRRLYFSFLTHCLRSLAPSLFTFKYHYCNNAVLKLLFGFQASRRSENIAAVCACVSFFYVCQCQCVWEECEIICSRGKWEWKDGETTSG